MEGQQQQENSVHTVVVEDLNPGTTEQQLREAFTGHKVLGAQVVVEAETGCHSRAPNEPKRRRST